jgi:hypothetical protein
MLLTVARQFVIFTRFPFNSDFHRKPIPVDKVNKELKFQTKLSIMHIYAELCYYFGN